MPLIPFRTAARLSRQSFLGCLGAFALTALMGTPAAQASVFDSLSPDNEMVLAIEKRNREDFMLALVNDIRPTTRDALGVPAIIIAVESKDAFFVEQLLAHGARPDDQPRDDERTALSRAAELGETAMVRALLEHGADPDRPGVRNEAPLIKAAHAGHVDVVRILLENGADYSITEMTGRTPLEVAERSGHTQIAAILREAGAQY